MRASPKDFRASGYEFQGNACYDRNAVSATYGIIEVWAAYYCSVRSGNDTGGTPPYAPNGTDIVNCVNGCEAVATTGSWGAISSHDFTDWRTVIGTVYSLPPIGIQVFDANIAYSLSYPPMPAPFTSLLYKGYAAELSDAGSFNPSGGGAAETFPNDGAGGLLPYAGYPSGFTHPGTSIFAQLVSQLPNAGNGLTNAINRSYGGGGNPWFENLTNSILINPYDTCQPNDVMCSMWIYNEDVGNYTDGGGHVTNIMRNRVIAQRVKWRSSTGISYWWASADLWPDVTNGYANLRNITLLGQSNAVPSQWVDLGFVQASGSPDTSIPTGTPNGIGRIMLCVCNQTPAAWSTATGLTFTNYP